MLKKIVECKRLKTGEEDWRRLKKTENRWNKVELTFIGLPFIDMSEMDKFVNSAKSQQIKRFDRSEWLVLEISTETLKYLCKRLSLITVAVSCLVFRTQNKDIYNREADVFIILVLVMF